MPYHYFKYCLSLLCGILLLCSSLISHAQKLPADCNGAINWDTTFYKFSYEQNLKEVKYKISLAKRNQDLLCEANWYRRLGLLFYRNGNYKEAANAYVLSITKSEKAKDLLSIASTCNQLGKTYYNLREYPKSQEYFLKSYALFLDLEDQRGQADLAGNIGETYLMLNELKLSELYFRKSLLARKKWGVLDDIGYNYYWLGCLMNKMIQYDSALWYFGKAIFCFQNNHDIEGLVNTYKSKGDLLIAKGEIEPALLSFQSGYQVAVSNQLVSSLPEILDGLSSCFAVKSDFDNAYRYLKLKSILLDTILNDAVAKHIIEADFKYETKAKERELETRKLIIKKKNITISVFLCFIIIILISLILAIKLILKNKKLAKREAELYNKKVDDILQQQEIDNVNSLLKGQNSERRRIAQELHDSLGSILSTIKLHFSSMETAVETLKIQQSKSYSEANNLLDEACEEVRRISHDLYEGSLEKFGLRTALGQLITAIEKANNLKITFLDNNISEDYYYSIEKELYRISQELLSNTLKYAKATKATIQLNVNNEILQFQYEDNGIGMDPLKLEVSEGIGFKNIRERVSKLKGIMNVDTSLGHGLTVFIEIPHHG